MRRLHAEVSAALEAAKTPIETINELAGPNPGPLPAQLKTMLNMGAGYFRTVNATIERLFRERNAERLRQLSHENKKQPSTREPQPNDWLKPHPFELNPQSSGQAGSPDC